MTLRRRAVQAAAGGALCALIASAAAAQSADEQIRNRAAEFIRTTGVASGDTPAARWADPVCPRVLGLSEEGGRAAERIMRGIAEDAGVPVAPAPCDSNVVVTFTANAPALMRQIESRSPGRLSQVPATARETLMSGTMPVRWWYLTETRGRHAPMGRDQSGNQAVTVPINSGAGAGSGLAGEAPTVMHYENSMISTLTTRVLTSASIVIDQNAVMGSRLGTLAAYAAMVAFAEIRAPQTAPEGSILSAFSARNGPRSLTVQDRAFLRALYRMPLDRQARRHRAVLMGEMVEAQTNASPSS
jgi:hypothetical protein